MKADRLALAGLVLVALGLVAAGLLTVGGPGAGRSEQRDRTRLGDVERLGNYVACVADTNGGVLPDALRPVGTCAGGERFEDPFDGTPYTYEKLSDTAYRLCAAFEDPGRLDREGWARLDSASGCIQFTYAPG